MVAPFALIFAACSEEPKTEEVVKLETSKDKLSYCMGADFARPILQAGDVIDFMNFEKVADGFAAALNENDYSSCNQVMLEAFGPQFMQIDSSRIDEGSECFGKLNGSQLYMVLKEVNKLEKFDLEKMAIGFRHALMKGDTLVETAERAKILQEFQDEVMAEQRMKLKEMDGPFLNAAKALPNTREIDGGIVIETIKEGKGSSPSMTDDVRAHYVVTMANGDTLESSFVAGKPIDINLQGAFMGWRLGFPNLKKGGKYNLYLPSDMGSPQNPQPLKFYIEFIDFGPMGTFTQQ